MKLSTGKIIGIIIAVLISILIEFFLIANFSEPWINEYAKVLPLVGLGNLIRFIVILALSLWLFTSVISWLEKLVAHSSNKNRKPRK